MDVDAQHRQLVDGAAPMRLLVNIDVPDLAAGEAFYTAAWGLIPVRREASPGYLEMTGLAASICLIEVAAGSPATPGGATRGFARHWCPIHLDIGVDDLGAAQARAEAAGATAESPVRDEPFGRIVTMADPFGHGFCLIQFNQGGYDAVA